MDEETKENIESMSRIISLGAKGAGIGAWLGCGIFGLFIIHIFCAIYHIMFLFYFSFFIWFILLIILIFSPLKMTKNRTYNNVLINKMKKYVDDINKEIKERSK